MKDDVGTNLRDRGAQALGVANVGDLGEDAGVHLGHVEQRRLLIRRQCIARDLGPQFAEQQR